MEPVQFVVLFVHVFGDGIKLGLQDVFQIFQFGIVVEDHVVSDLLVGPDFRGQLFVEGMELISRFGHFL